MFRMDYQNQVVELNSNLNFLPVKVLAALVLTINKCTKVFRLNINQCLLPFRLRLDLRFSNSLSILVSLQQDVD